MAGLTGLTGIAQQQRQVNEEPQADAEERSGGSADPRHARIGSLGERYPWESHLAMAGSHGPYGLENQLLGDPEWIWESGGDPTDDPDFDRTPSHRAGPFPKGINSGPIPGENPDDVAEQLRQSSEIHAVRTGAGLKTLHALDAHNNEWCEIWQVKPGSSDQVSIPRQLMSSGYLYGTTDRVQSMARQNQYGFDSSHQHRRYADAPIPGNYMWMKPGQRPMLKTLAGPARPAIGKDSPFRGQDLGTSFSYDGAVLQNVPSEYVAPAQPNLGTAPRVDEDTGTVEWY